MSLNALTADGAAFLALAEAVPAFQPAPEPDIPPSRLLTLDELAALPPPTWLIDGMIPRGGLACVYGPSGAGKSFLALDWALSIATGTHWIDHEVQAGNVIYVAAEGHIGLATRVEAWQIRHGAGAAPFYVLPDAVNLMDAPSVELLLTDIQNRAPDPALIVVDTLARCMVGGDENGTKDMGLFTASADRLRKATGATVLIIHHTGKDPGRGERGNSSLRAACDTMISLTADDGLISLECDKQKDALEFAPSQWVLEPVGASCVLALAGTTALAGARGQMTPAQRQILEVLSSPILAGGATAGEIGNATQLPPHQVYRGLKGLEARGYLEIDGPPKSHNRRYRPSAHGAAAVGLTHITNTSLTLTDSQSALTPSLTHTDTPFMGVSVSQSESGPVSDGDLSAGQEKSTAQPDPLTLWQPTGPHKQEPPAGICDQPGHQVQYYRRSVWKCRTCWEAEQTARNGAPAAEVP